MDICVTCFRVKTPVISTVTHPFTFYNHVTEAIYFRKKLRPLFRPDVHVIIFLLTITEMMTVTVHFKNSHNADKEQNLHLPRYSHHL